MNPRRAPAEAPELFVALSAVFERSEIGVTAVNDWILKGAAGVSADGVSADGTVIVGWAFNTVTKQWEAFRAVLPRPT
jgi:hypothetical protein